MGIVGKVIPEDFVLQRVTAKTLEWLWREWE